MTPPTDPSTQGRSPYLGRLVAVLILGLVMMVLLGIYGIWSYASREKDWRNQVNTSESFLVPTNRPAPR